MRFTSGRRSLFQGFVSGVDDERVQWLLFETKWVGYADAKNTWEPYTNLT